VSLRNRVSVLTATAIVTLGVVAPAGAPTSRSAPGTPPASLPGTLRFSAPSYTTSGCVSTILYYTGGLTPALDLISKTTGDHEHVALLPSVGTWAPSKCLHLSTAHGKPNNGVLQVAPGDTVFVFARSSPTVIAVGAFLVNGIRAGAPSPPKLVVKSATLPAGLRSGPLGPNARIIGPKGVTLYLAERAVIVEETAPGDLAHFLTRRHGHDLGESVIGSPASGQTIYHTVSLDPLAFNDTGLASRLATDHVKGGTFTFSSVRARKLLGLILTEQSAGLAIWPDVLHLPLGEPTTDEGSNGSMNPSDDFSNDWSNPAATNGTQDVRLGQAQGVLHLMKIPPGSFTNIAVIDGGFGGPNDFGGGFTAPDYGAPGGKFNNIPQCDVDAVGGTNCNPVTGPAQGKSNTPCQGSSKTFSCDWHGMQMASAAAGRIDNQWGGSAGVAAQTSNLHLYKIAFDYTIPLASAISTATKQSANVISISSGAPCILGGVDFCDGVTVAGFIALCATLPIAWMGGPLAVAAAVAACASVIVASTFDAISKGVSFAEAFNVVVVAAAGNTATDPSTIKQYPCVVTHVLCVGELMAGSPAPVSVSGGSFGSAIGIWAPGTNVAVMPDPSSGGKITLDSGTSPATAFIAGVAGVARAIDPALTAAQTRALIENTACKASHTARIVGPACTPSSDARLAAAGYVDVLEVVRTARQLVGLPSLGTCTGGFDEATPTGDGPSSPTDLGTFPAKLSGNFVDQTGLDASLTDWDHTNDPAPDSRWYKFQITPSGISNKAISVRATITVPDTSLGTLQLSMWRLVGNKIGPPATELVTASLSQDSSSGTAYVEAPVVIGSVYAVEVTTVGPLQTNTNCYTELKLEARESSPDPPPHEPWLEVGSASIVAPTGNAVETRKIYVPVTLTAPLAFPVTVNYTFADDTAKAGVDYDNTPGSVVIPTGSTNVDIPVTVFPTSHTTNVDGLIHITSGQAPVLFGTGAFWLLTKPSGGQVNIGDTDIWEGDVIGGTKFVDLNVSLDAVASRPLTISYTTHDGTAKAGIDYVGASGSVVMAAGADTVTIPIQLKKANTFPENVFAFTVELTTTSAGAGLLGSHKVGTVTILDDDPRP